MVSISRSRESDSEWIGRASMIGSNGENCDVARTIMGFRRFVKSFICINR